VNPTAVFIKSGNSRHYILMNKIRFTLGSKSDDDIIINHQWFNSNRLIVDNGLFANGENYESKGIENNSRRRLLLEGFEIHIFKMARTILLGLIVILISFMFYISSTKSEPEQDWSPVDLPTRKAFGFSRIDKTHPKGIRFRFNLPKGDKGKVLFTLGGAGDAGKIIAVLDGRTIVDELSIPEGWGGTEEIQVPESSILNEHILEFRILNASQNPLPWGIRDVQIIPAVARSTPDDTELSLIVSYFSEMENLQIDVVELSNIYKTLSDKITAEFDPAKLKILNTLKNKTNEKIELALNSEHVRIMSLISSGNLSAAEKRINKLKQWIPIEWQRHRMFSEYG
jgi:hypothetical protein